LKGLHRQRQLHRCVRIQIQFRQIAMLNFSPSRFQLPNVRQPRFQIYKVEPILISTLRAAKSTGWTWMY